MYFYFFCQNNDIEKFRVSGSCVICEGARKRLSCDSTFHIYVPSAQRSDSFRKINELSHCIPLIMGREDKKVWFLPDMQWGSLQPQGPDGLKEHWSHLCLLSPLRQHVCLHLFLPQIILYTNLTASLSEMQFISCLLKLGFKVINKTFVLSSSFFSGAITILYTPALA